MTIIIGINAYHGDSSACLIKDGILLAAVEEERFRREKHWAGFPTMSIKYCLEAAGISLSDVDHIAINQNFRSNSIRKLLYLFKGQFSLKSAFNRFENKRKRFISQELLLNHFNSRFNGQVHYVEHHLAHLASAYFVSPFEKAAIVSVDGFGDFASTYSGLGDAEKLTVLGGVYFPHSLGILYQAITQWLGFDNYGDEYKVMGLAPYGNELSPNKIEGLINLRPGGLFELNLDYFQHHREHIQYQWEGIPKVDGRLYSEKLCELIGNPRKSGDPITQMHMDIAKSVQLTYEKSLFHILNHLHSVIPTNNLCMAGGCANNSVANGKIHLYTPFKNVYIQSAAGDAGGAIGAAFVVWNRLGGKKKFVMKHAYWGPQFENIEIEKLLVINREQLNLSGCSIEIISDINILCRRTAHAISEGSVIGWFQGRMEWGPRALGNRSILGDPRRRDMKDILNLKIKRRESFRPFAPSILEESTAEWFEYENEVPFMMQVYSIKVEKRSLVPAVTHVDGSGRLQTVSKETNPLYHELIKEFNAITGIPMVLNTSFNENEPVVCNPSEALDCFLRTKMDVLVMGDWYISRPKLK